ncbi:MAG: DUF115 domain-containing protein [Methanobrevibacter sp.]|jgi:uncharacterized Rossmann fold enzyme|nr:DUF115 domain-containing protein [Candidatus Methanoflexus mossambicus]
MKFEVWEKFYEKILADFGFSRDDDNKSAVILNEILFKSNTYSFEGIQTFIDESTDNNTTFVIFGAGPSLKNHIIEFKEMENKTSSFHEFFTIAADGATSALLEEDIVPDVVVTDLDGKMDDLLIANKKGSIFVIHAHGNNLDLINEYADKFNKSIGTTQDKPFGKLYNFGGFTDGDRAVFLAVELGAHNILLCGMDFGKYVTKYSRPNLHEDIALADDMKVKKLSYAEILIKWIEDNENVIIEFLD